MALIYIVEDDESIREIEEFALSNAGHQVKGFGDAKSLYAQMENVIPDLLLVDIMLPDENGDEIVRKMRNSQKTRKLPIIMVTAKTTELDLVKGFDVGADDYIRKPFSVMELISRVKAMLRRTEPTPVKTYSLDGLEVNNDKHEVTIDGEKITLTFKEYELLLYLMMNQGLVMSRNNIMDNVWDMNFEVESRTLDMHIRTLRKKLGPYGERIITVRNVGYKIE